MSMTDETNGSDVTPEELDASQTVDLRSLGIDPMTSPIADLVKVYCENHAIVTAYTERLKTQASDPGDPSQVIKSQVKCTLEGKGTSDEVKQTVGALRTQGESVANHLFDHSGFDLVSSAVMLEEMRNLVSLMEDEYAYHFNAAVQTEKDRLGIVSTPSESATLAKLICIKLKGDKPNTGLINARIQIARAMGEEDSIPDNLFKTGGERNGFNTDVFPRLPRLAIEGTPSSASPSTHLVFRFQAVGADEPVYCSETTLNDVAHNVVSEGAYRITGKRVAQDLQKAGFGLGATDEEWKLEYRTGTLMGRKA